MTTPPEKIELEQLERLKAVGREVIKHLAEHNPRDLLRPEVQELIKIITTNAKERKIK